MFADDFTKLIMEEIWRDIKDYEDLYAVSNQGRVKSLKFGKEKVLKAVKNSRGYLVVVLYKDGVKKQFTVHRLVAEAFLPKVEGKEFIDHINTDKTDNRASNLRWCTHKENCNNPLTIEKMKGEKNPMYGKSGYGKSGEKNPMYGKYGAEHPSSKPIVGVNKLTGEEVRFPCAIEAQMVLGIDCSSICHCCKGRNKSAGGYYWYYQEEEKKIS